MAGLGVLLLSVAFAVVPAVSPGAHTGKDVGRLVAIMPSIYLGFLVLAVVSAAASGGGREIVPREQAVAWPVSSMTDHFGALLLAPLNIAWLLQAWTLLGITAYVVGRPRHPLGHRAPRAALPGARDRARRRSWPGCSSGYDAVHTAWSSSAPPRSRCSVSLAALVLTHHLTDVLDQSPTVWVFVDRAQRLGR